jgi:hypothetical protein
MTTKTALHWIDNQWGDSQNQKNSFNPATGEIIGSYADGGRLKLRRLSLRLKKHLMSQNGSLIASCATKY